jgi:hypothetical protein
VKSLPVAVIVVFPTPGMIRTTADGWHPAESL